ncbi:MAG TPA: TonB-dependent receptor [Bacteroides sp.]|nr:TonB-dependent receptor [Bacteroides sp.]
MKRSVILIILVSLAHFLSAQDVTLKGIVRDQEGIPLPGVSVYIEGTTRGVITNLDGEFEIEVDPRQDAVLLFSSVGFEPESRRIGDGTTFFEITMRPKITELDDVVVIGYGTQRRGDVTVAISSVDAGAVSSPVHTSLDQALQGQAAGVVVMQSTGKPGAPVSVRIRGTTSINGTNEPLYVVDGIPIITKAEELTTGTVQGSDINPLSSINPADIESIQVLKDASATAIYGARGANGVVLITTRKGKAGKPQVNISSTVGLQVLAKKLDLLNARELAELGNAAVAEARKYYPDIAYGDNFAFPDRFGEGTDWQDEIFRQAWLHNHQVSLSGGEERTRYFMSANLMQQDGIIHNSDFNKGTFRINMDSDLGENVRTGVNINFTRSISHGVITGVPNFSSSVTAMALMFNPAQEPYDPDGPGGYTYESNTINRVPNPVAEINETDRLVNSNRAIGDFYLDWDIIPGLQYRFKLGADAFFTKEQQYIPSYIKRGQDKGKGYDVNMQGYTWLMENTLSYTKEVNKHHLVLLVGQTAQKYISESTDIAIERFDDDRLGYYNLGLGLDKTVNTGFQSWAMLSGIGRAIYNYDSRYYVTLSGRADGSSKFGMANKWGFFPSVSLAWRVSGEDFFSSVDAVNSLKIRASFGTVGNEGIPPGSTISLMGELPYFFGEMPTSRVVGTYVYSLKNNELKWEVTRQYNTGFDLSMFESRIMLTVEAYLKHTSDLLLYVPINRSSGFEYAWANVGDMSNRGIEFSLNTVNIQSPFEWRTRLNMAFNRNSVTNLAGSQDIYGIPIMNILDWTRISENNPIGMVYGYKTDGILQLDEDPSSQPFFPSKIIQYGDRKYVDRNEDGVITTDDHFVLGNVNPDFTFGFSNHFGYKGISLDIYLQGDIGNELVNFNKFQLESFDGYQNNLATALERWTENNPTDEYPRANASSHGNFMSDVIVEDGSYMRVKEVTLAYDLPSRWFSEIPVSSIRVALSGNNLWTFTRYSGFDPEVSIYGGNVFGKGADYGAYPMARSVLFTLNLVF